MKKRILHLYEEIMDIDFVPAVFALTVLTIPLIPFFLVAWIIETLIEKPE
jgi:hypothetical protein